MRWSGVHAHWTIAAGSSAGRPAAISSWHVSARRPAAMSTTTVSAAVATLPRSTPPPCAVEPVTTVKDRATPRCVTGIPAAAGAATAAETPGTISHGTPAPMHAASSSPPRPNTNGSPPFRRTTVAPPRARSTRIRSISSCGIARRPGSLPT